MLKDWTFLCLICQHPDMRDYFRDNYKVFSRVSEVELDPSWYQCCSGIWLDSFETNWFNSALIEKYISDEKRYVLYLQNFMEGEYTDLWDIIYPLRGEENIMLCTDLPTEAELFFNLPNNNMKIKAIFFDMDGVLIEALKIGIMSH